jgi:hypothetical protein
VTNSTIAAAALSGNRQKPFKAGRVTSILQALGPRLVHPPLRRQSELAAEVITAGRLAFRDVSPCLVQVFANPGLGKAMDCFLQGFQIGGGHRHG